MFLRLLPPSTPWRTTVAAKRFHKGGAPREMRTAATGRFMKMQIEFAPPQLHPFFLFYFIVSAVKWNMGTANEIFPCSWKISRWCSCYCGWLWAILGLLWAEENFFFSFPLLIKTGLRVHTLKALRVDVKQLQFEVRAGIQWCEILQDQSDTK